MTDFYIDIGDTTSFTKTVSESDVDQFAGERDSLTVDDVELCFLERGRELVLDHLHSGAVSKNVLPLLDTASPADVHSDR